MSRRIAEALRLSPADRVADIGSGIGLFARKVARLLQPGARPSDSHRQRPAQVA